VHFVVADLATACAEIECAGGRIVGPPTEVAPGVIGADVLGGGRVLLSPE
jgi:predicted enzyme related to lactoylglutathione lyase